VPETSRGLHHWQPAPGWRLLRWLAHSGNPVMNLHTEGRRTDTCHNDKSLEREEGTGKGKQPLT